MNKSLILASLIIFGTHSAFAEEFDLGVESDMAFADSESSLAAEEEAARRAQEEKARATQEKEIADRETAKARQLEATAKAKMAEWAKEEKARQAEYKAAEKRKLAALEKIRVLENQMSAREAELKALTDLADQTVAERDKYEAAIEKTNDRINQIEIRMRQQTERRKAAEADKTRLAANLKQRRAHMKALARRPASRDGKAVGAKRVRAQQPMRAQGDKSTATQ